MEEQDWEKILKELEIYAYSIIKSLDAIWCRGSEALPRGVEPIDFATEVCLEYLETPQKFDAERNEDLISYLKLNLLKHKIFNLLNKKEHKTAVDFEKNQNSILTIRVSDISIEDKMLCEQVENLLINDISDDKLLEDIFFLVYNDGYERAAAAQKLNITVDEYDAALKRLNRKLNNIGQHLAVKPEGSSNAKSKK